MGSEEPIQTLAPEKRRFDCPLKNHQKHAVSTFLDARFWQIANMIQPGTHLGPYVIDRPLGAGNTGTVYRAFDSANNEPVAIKVLRAKRASDDAAVAMFLEEAKVGLTVKHEHIVQTLYVDRFGDLPYIVFELVSGTPLGKLLEKGALVEGEALWILRQMAQALRELRRKNIVHQDIKPENILIDKEGLCKLTDLGFARTPTGKIDWDGYSVGTAYYMSPEQYRGQKEHPPDHRSDLYCLGATIFHAATGRHVFEGQEEDEIFDQLIHDKAPFAAEVNKKLSVPFSQVLSKCLEKDPGNRYQTAEELLLGIRNLKTRPVAPHVTPSRLD